MKLVIISVPYQSVLMISVFRFNGEPAFNLLQVLMLIGALFFSLQTGIDVQLVELIALILTGNNESIALFSIDFTFTSFSVPSLCSPPSQENYFKR